MQPVEAGGEGLSLQSFVEAEMRLVYGARNVGAVHLVSHSQQVARLLAAYEATVWELQDLLASYEAALYTGEAQPLGSSADSSSSCSSSAKVIALKQLPLPQVSNLLPTTAAEASLEHSSKGMQPSSSSRALAAAPAASLPGTDPSAARGNSPAHQAGPAHARHRAPAPRHTSTARPALLGSCCGRRAKGEAMAVLLERLAGLKVQIEQVQSEAEAHPEPAAFVTFNSHTAAAVAISARHSPEPALWSIQGAPVHDALIHAKLGMRSWEAGLRRALVYLGLALLALLYVVPVSFVQGILQLDRLAELPVIGTLVSLPVVRSLLLGVLPGLALRLFVLLLPLLLFALNRRADSRGEAQLDGRVATHLFVMQLVVVFLGSFVAGSLLNQIGVWLTAPEQALTILGTGVPQTANFFILYIVLSAFIGRSWSLLRPWGLLMTGFRLIGAHGERGRARAVLAGTYRMFGPAVPEAGIMLLLGLVFATLQPFVLLASLVWLLMARVVETHNWVYVFRRPYEGGGRLWRALFRHVLVALYFAQLAIAALLIVKRFVWVVLLVPLFAATALVHHLGSVRLMSSWAALSMQAARRLDAATEGDQRAEAGQLYRPPAVQLLDAAAAQRGELEARVASVKARVASHNRAAAARV